MKRWKMPSAKVNKRYRELAEMLPQTVYEHDMDGKLTYLNQAGKKTFGIESLETGVSARDLVVAEDIERMLSNMQKSSFGNSTSRVIHTRPCV
jgi:PAS domain S-box-containing protein